METVYFYGGQSCDTGFKSHHSGMETWFTEWYALAQRMALNRTIVGWKQYFPGAPGNGPPALNRTIVGWKLILAMRALPEAPAFKSHHSGMETEVDKKVPLNVIPLNRTIVGWKPATNVAFRVPPFSLNRTIVGWKHDGGQGLQGPKAL